MVAGVGAGAGAGALSALSAPPGADLAKNDNCRNYTLYLCITLSTLTLITSLVALYILVSRLEETGMGAQKAEH